MTDKNYAYIRIYLQNWHLILKSVINGNAKTVQMKFKLNCPTQNEKNKNKITP